MPPNKQNRCDAPPWPPGEYDHESYLAYLLGTVYWFEDLDYGPAARGRRRQLSRRLIGYRVSRNDSGTWLAPGAPVRVLRSGAVVAPPPRRFASRWAVDPWVPPAGVAPWAYFYIVSCRRKLGA